jgi:predicted transcriptional regulator
MNQAAMVAMIKLIKGEQQATVVSYIIDKLDLKKNLLMKTQREIAQDCGVSTKTVSEIITLLCKEGFLKKKYGRSSGGAYMVSPKLFYRGYEHQKTQLIYDFDNFDQKPKESLK